MPTCRSFISPLAVALAIALVPGATLAQGAAGSWAQDGDRSSCSPRSIGHLVVSRTAIQQGNSKCRFGGNAPAGFAAVRGNMVCSAGVSSIDIRAVGNRLTILQNGYQTTYERCVGVATEPVFDRGPNRREERRAQRRQDERGEVYREVQPAPLTEKEAAAKLMIDLLSGAFTNQQ